LSQYGDAHEAATLALMLEPENVKAYYTRHRAKAALGDYRVSILCCSKTCIEHPCLSTANSHFEMRSYSEVKKLKYAQDLLKRGR